MIKRNYLLLAILLIVSSCKKTDGDDLPLLCDSGYEGALCDVTWREKFFGTYSATDQCDTSVFTITIEEYGSDPKLLRVINLLRNGDTLACGLTESKRGYVIGYSSKWVEIQDSVFTVNWNTCDITAIRQ